MNAPASKQREARLAYIVGLFLPNADQFVRARAQSLITRRRDY